MHTSCYCILDLLCVKCSGILNGYCTNKRHRGTTRDKRKYEQVWEVRKRSSISIPNDMLSVHVQLFSVRLVMTYLTHASTTRQISLNLTKQNNLNRPFKLSFFIFKKWLTLFSFFKHSSMLSNLESKAYDKANTQIYKYNEDPLEASPTYSYLAPKLALILIVTRHLVSSPFLIVWLAL